VTDHVALALVISGACLLVGWRTFLLIQGRRR